MQVWCKWGGGDVPSWHVVLGHHPELLWPPSNLSIYYYTPLPLNLANKQARHHSVLAIAPSQRLGLYSTQAILEPRCPCQIQLLSQKLTGGAPGRGRQVRGCPPKTAHFVPQNSLFWPERASNPVKTAKQRQTVANTPRAPQLPRDQEPFVAL